jgi:CRP-like cAMP-binding protein
MSAVPENRVGIDGLRACGLFAGVDDVHLESVARQMRARRYRDGETIFHQDDPGDSLHVVVEGGVKIVLPSAEDGEPAIIATLRPGDFFGALALLDGAPRSATAASGTCSSRWSANTASSRSRRCPRPSAPRRPAR